MRYIAEEQKPEMCMLEAGDSIGSQHMEEEDILHEIDPAVS